MQIDLDIAPALARSSRRASRFWTPRCDTVEKLREALAGDLVLVRGPAGVGKSTLLRQLADALADDPDAGVQFVDATRTAPELIGTISDAFHEGPRRHILIVDDIADDSALTSGHILDMLRADADLRVVAATRHVTRLEDPLVALEFDVQVLPPADLLMSPDEVALVLDLNGVVATDAALGVFLERTHGWPALAQLASSRLRLEGLSLRTPDDAEAIAEYARRSLTEELERHLATPVNDELRVLAVAPFVTADLAEAIGIAGPAGTAHDLLGALQDAGMVWPSATRLVLAEPVRVKWLREIETRQPEVVERARLRLLDHLVCTGEPLRAAQLAADAAQWVTLASVLRSSGPEIWARDPAALRQLVTALRSRAGFEPLAIDALLALDPETATSTETPVTVVAALSRLPEAKAAARGDIEGLTLRVHLLRAAGRFALASEAAALLLEALRRRPDLRPEAMIEGWHQVGMTHLAMGRLRDASLTMGQIERIAPPAPRVRARGFQALVALLEGDVRAAGIIVDETGGDAWLESPWGESVRLAAGWVAIERGDAARARALLEGVPATGAARELWPLVASAQALALLLSGAASDALGLLRSWSARSRSTPPSHFHATQMLTARAKVLIALRQARKASALFEGPFSLSSGTAPAISLSLLYAGRTHDAYVLGMKWGFHHEAPPRAALESMVVSIVADIRLNGSAAQRSTVQRAEAISSLHDLWSPWSAMAPEDRPLVLRALSSGAREKVSTRDSFFASAVSVPHLTKREQVVLVHLTPASTIADVARKLVVSPNTVKTQLQSLYRKLGVSDRASAIRAAHAWGLIDTDREG